MRSIRVCVVIIAFGVPAAVSAATIYKCRSYSGGEFWSSAHCHRQQAVILRMATVPDGMPFEQQVRIVEGEVSRMTNRGLQEDAQRDRANRCAQLKLDRDKIWSRYSNWQYQPAEVVGPDRTRWKAIESEQARLNCEQR